VLVGLWAAVSWALWAYAQRSEAFRIAHVHLPPNSSFQLRRPLIGVNIWELDLEALAAELERQQPSLRAVRVVRELPNAIRVVPIPRVPVAQVRLDRWYLVDRDGFILPGGSVAPEGRLVRLVGFERGASLRAGHENTDERLLLALRVLERLRQAAPVLRRRLTQINVADAQQIRFTLDDALEVRCGREAELEAHVGRLREALRALARQPLDVQYIDVRFQEPVLGPRT
jgi:cell division septal protein FtsQ